MKQLKYAFSYLNRRRNSEISSKTHPQVRLHIPTGLNHGVK